METTKYSDLCIGPEQKGEMSFMEDYIQPDQLPANSCITDQNLCTPGPPDKERMGIDPENQTLVGFQPTTTPLDEPAFKNQNREDINLKASFQEKAEPTREPESGGVSVPTKPPDEPAFTNQAREDIGHLLMKLHSRISPGGHKCKVFLS